MPGHCNLKYKLARDMMYGRQQVTVIAFIDLDSQIDEYHTGVAQFRHVICHHRSVRSQRYAPMSLFFVAAADALQPVTL